MKVFATKTFLIWLSSLFLLFYLGFIFFPHSPTSSNTFLENLTNWDGKYYLSIAEKGYSDPILYAFFPAYPLMIRVVNLVFNNLTFSAIFVSIISSFLAVFHLFKLIKLDFKEDTAYQTVVYTLLFPTSFYLLTAYSEGLFFLLVILSFYNFRKENFVWCTLFAIIASFTRAPGLILALSLILAGQINGGLNKKNWILIFSPLGFIIYCFYLYSQTGDPLYFMEAEKNWQRQLSFPWVGFWQNITNILQPGFVQQYYYVLSDLLFAILGVGLAIRAYRLLPPVYWIYTLGSVLLPLLTSSLTSMPRLLLPVFPIFILVALWKNKLLILLIQITWFILLITFAILFFNGYWIA